jgi:hypothetical protein
VTNELAFERAGPSAISAASLIVELIREVGREPRARHCRHRPPGRQWRRCADILSVAAMQAGDPSAEGRGKDTGTVFEQEIRVAHAWARRPLTGATIGALACPHTPSFSWRTRRCQHHRAGLTENETRTCWAILIGSSGPVAGTWNRRSADGRRISARWRTVTHAGPQAGRRGSDGRTPVIWNGAHGCPCLAETIVASAPGRRMFRRATDIAPRAGERLLSAPAAGVQRDGGRCRGGAPSTWSLPR